MNIKKIKIEIENDYFIYLGQNILSAIFVDYCRTLTQKIVIVTDSNLIETHGEALRTLLQSQNIMVDLLAIPAGEQYKTRETKQILEDKLFEKNYGRDTCLIALGGGVVSDLVGFVAATYCRGIPVIYVPTTLLAMVDASIGGKTAVDTSFGKNLIGAFYQPAAVFIEMNFLQTLPENEWKNGIVEIIKHGAIADKKLFELLKKNPLRIKEPDFLIDVIEQSSKIKKSIVEKDVRDHGIRQLLNFGHSIGHAIEVIENYKISHGEAVAIGMIVEAQLSVLKGFADKLIVAEVLEILRDYHLPLQTSAFQNLSEFKAKLGMDKKALKNQARFVLLDSIGKAHVKNDRYTFEVSDEQFGQAINVFSIAVKTV